ncbi:MAG: hypothetical protein M3R43_05030 [Acidobacteriota bacterium]|nr:hypothetical protein [Acidobacteriota bacterium]
MRPEFIIAAVLACAVTGVSQTVPCSNMTVGNNGALNGFVPSPNDAWHLDISAATVDPGSAKIIATSGDLGGAHLHPDFSSVAGGNYGIPYTVVDSANTPAIPVPIVLYPTESDITLYPVPSNLPIEGNPGLCPTDGADRHAIVIDRNQCVAYEMYQAAHCNGGFKASQGTVWDFTTTENRPYGFTSVDAAGLSVFEGLVRYDEIVAGVINHALRFTAQHTKNDANHGFFTAPAIHAAGNSSSTDNIMGMRIRLKASFDISGYSPTNQIILRAMKQYGMILADNGSNLFFQGAPDARWNDNDLSALKVIPATAFDVVQMNPVYDSSTAPKGAAPQIASFTASATPVPAGTPVTLTPTVTGASYNYVDKVGFIRGPVTVSPTVTTTYTLTSRNAFGTSSASTTVTISGSMITPTLTFATIPNMTFGAAPFTVSATSASSGAVTYAVGSGPATVSGNTVTITAVGTVVLNATQAASGNYTAASATTSFTVNPGNPALAFVTIPSQTSTAPPFTVSTTTQSSGSISYSVVSGPATISGNTVTLAGTVGTVNLQATQAATGNYTAATATTSFSVTSGTPPMTLTFATVPTATFGAGAFAVSATSSSPGAVTYYVTVGHATVSGNMVTPTGVGTVTLLAKQAASGSYPAAMATTSFSVVAAVPVLNFATVPNPTYGSAPFNVIATSASSGAVTYSVVSGPATLSGRSVTLTGVGTVTLNASQAALGNYTAATTTTSFTVAPATPRLTFTPISTKTFQSNPPVVFAVSAASASPGAIAYSVQSGPATVSGQTVTLTGVGTVTLQADQAAAGNYTAATTTTSFAVQ